MTLVTILKSNLSHQRNPIGAGLFTKERGSTVGYNYLFLAETCTDQHKPVYLTNYYPGYQTTVMDQSFVRTAYNAFFTSGNIKGESWHCFFALYNELMGIHMLGWKVNRATH